MSVREVSVVVVLVFSIYFLCHCKHQNEMCISPTDGKNIKPHPSCKIMVTLSQFCQDPDKFIKNDLVITLLNGTHKLDTACDMKSISNTIFTGSGAVVKCSSLSNGTGFRFQDVSNLKIFIH